MASLALAACSSGTDDASAEDTTTTTEAPSTTVAQPAGTVIATADSDLGSILVDGDGNTLYLFTPDDGGPSVCYDECATNWPPLGGTVEAGAGVDASLIGSAARDDGTEQATYAGWPLYYFAADAAAGDVNGQGVNGVWFVVAPDGTAIGIEAAGQDASTDAPDDSSFEY